jgi:cation diffusion facilitator family transporter
MIALLVLLDSIYVLFNPKQVYYNQAILVAFIGFVVNAISIKILHFKDDHNDNHSHDHHHSHEHNHSHGHSHDVNLMAAYAHVVVDAMTSVFAIFALLVGKYFNWLWVDPLVGIIGAVIIANWAYSLINKSTYILLDRQPSQQIIDEIKLAIESDKDSKLVDLHVWHLAHGKLSAILSIVSHKLHTVDDYKKRLSNLNLAHITIELNKCQEH